MNVILKIKTRMLQKGRQNKCDRQMCYKERERDANMILVSFM